MRKSISLLLAALSLPALVAAQPRGYSEYPEDENVRLVYADVLRVDPVYESVRVNEPREECYDTEVSRRGGRYENTNTGTIVGALIGGALGNQVGKGDGRRAATVAGAVIGGAVGREVDANDNPSRTYRGVETRCRVVESGYDERRIVGYDVEYRYRGEVFFSRLGYDPGEKLRVRVSVEPADP
ncbi:MAG: glycine zipper 2TM domain-containing protein [Rhodanobacteraceae bacterium]|nr:glycine zipper 2TM domain-containing protein [Rhodanobacteraceae bacterium]